MTAAPIPTRTDRLHLGHATIGLALGLVALGLDLLASRRTRQAGPWIAVALATAALVVLVADDQLAPGAVLVLVAAALTGAGAGSAVRRLHLRSLDAYLGVGVACAALFAVVPDTEGAVLLGAAVVPGCIAAIARPTWWRATGAGAVVLALPATVALIVAGSDGGRSGVGAVALGAAATCAAAAIVAGRLLRGGPALTSGPERPSP